MTRSGVRSSAFPSGRASAGLSSACANTLALGLAAPVRLVSRREFGGFPSVGSPLEPQMERSPDLDFWGIGSPRRLLAEHLQRPARRRPAGRKRSRRPLRRRPARPRTAPRQPRGLHCRRRRPPTPPALPAADPCCLQARPSPAASESSTTSESTEKRPLPTAELIREKLVRTFRLSTVNMLRAIRTALPPRRGHGIPAPALSLAGPFPQPVRPGQPLDRQPGGPGAASAPRAPCPHRSPTSAFRGPHPQKSVHSP